MFVLAITRFLFATFALLLTHSHSLTSGSLADRNGNEECKRQLEAVLFSPESCAKEYLAGIDAQLRQYGPLVLFTPRGQALIDSLERNYGVTIEVTNPFQQGCSVYSNLDSQQVDISPVGFPTLFPFNNGDGQSGVITSIKVSVDATTNNAIYLALTLRFGPNVAVSPFIPLLAGDCLGSAAFQGSFEDGGLTISGNCGNLNNGLTFTATGGSLMDAVAANGVTANTPMFLGVRSLSGSVSYQSANLTVCWRAANAFSQSLLRSNMNVPGFSVGDDAYHYTSIYYDSFAEMRYVTISAPKTTIFCNAK